MQRVRSLLPADRRRFFVRVYQREKVSWDTGIPEPQLVEAVAGEQAL